MIKRSFWIEKIEDFWEKKSIIWLSGVRRAGKTFLCKSIENVEYFDCELMSVRKELENYEMFLKKFGDKKRKIVLDEIHKLENPSEILKVAADYHKNLKIIATGSSMLGASVKFKDTLTDRKSNLLFTPMITYDLKDFKNEDIPHRFLHGGLPPFFLSKDLPEHGFQDWIDSYWAKDVQELFRLLNRSSFQKFFELLFIQSGGIFEATRFTQDCEVSRTSITNYLKVLEETFVVHIIKPFSTRKSTEIVSAPKVYAFDTGFVCYHKGWNKLRDDDYGILWEHFVLNELIARMQSRRINYWRDKKGHEIDFIIQQRGKAPIAIECKWLSGKFDPKNLEVFRNLYPNGKNFVVSGDINRSYFKEYNGVEVQFVNLNSLMKGLLSV